MTKRLVLTFESTFAVLKAEQLLSNFKSRTCPTPPGLSHSVCSISIELLDLDKRNEALELLEQSSNKPTGVYEV
jgi:hypothetical protein